ncbi:MAG: hypothetical protein ACOX6T_00310 [Myxococcales bacterium]|jgi:hypothetical protein
MRTRILSLALIGLIACGKEPEPPVEQPDAGEQPPPVCPDRKGIICPWAGTGAQGFDSDLKPILESQLDQPTDLVFTGDNVAYVVDRGNHLVRKVTPEGTFVSVMGAARRAGDGAHNEADSFAPGVPGITVAINEPTNAVVMPNGSVVVACWRNHKLRTLTPATGKVYISAGSFQCASSPACSDTTPPRNGDGKSPLDALFDFPSKLAVNSLGELFIVDQRVQRIRRIDARGSEIVTMAGSGKTGYLGDDGQPTKAYFHFDNSQTPKPSGGLAFDDAGNLYVADSLSHRIRKIEFVETTGPTGEKRLVATRISLFAGRPELDDLAPGYEGDGGPAIGARLNNPTDLEMGPDNKLYFADTGNHVIRAIDLSQKTIETVVGTGTMGDSGDSGAASSAELSHPMGIAFDSKGVLYIADTGNHRIRRVPLP